MNEDIRVSECEREREREKKKLKKNQIKPNKHQK